MPRPARSASRKKYLAKTKTTAAPLAVLSVHPLPPMRVQCGSTTRGLANNSATLSRSRLATSTREFPPRTSHRSPRVLPARPIPPPYRLQKSARDLCRLDSSSFTVLGSTQLRSTVSWRLQHVAQIFLRLKQCVFRRCLGYLEHPGNLRMTESFHFVQQKNVALVPRQLFERALQCHPQGRMRSRRARLHARCLCRVLVGRHFFFPQPAAPRVIARVDQDPVRPGHKTRLPAKTCNASLHFQECFLHGVFRVRGATQHVPRKVFHPRAVQRVQPLIRAQVSRPARRGH